jgi:hypothetical protein
MRFGKGIAFVALVAIAFVFAASASGFSSGINRSNGLTEEGCICHGPGGSGGKPSPAVEVLILIGDNPYHYEAGETYNITITALTDVPASAAGNKGGFNLRVSAGTLAAAPGFEERVQIVTAREATHTLDGDRASRVFNLTWTAPATGEEAVIFQAFVNTVNGDGAPNESDHWNGKVVVLMGESGVIGGEGEVNPEHFGVRWLAHWVGIISFIAVFAVLIIYYFVLKFGETVHATDHRDRKEK